MVEKFPILIFLNLDKIEVMCKNVKTDDRWFRVTDPTNIFQNKWS